MQDLDHTVLELIYERMINSYETTHMGKLFNVGDKVVLKHAQLKTPDRLYKNHKPGDLFEVLGRTPGTSSARRFYIKSLDTNEIYSAHGYHIQSANKPLEPPVLRVSKKLTGSITCANCKKEFDLKLPGKFHRDHCPHCLCSVHIDSKPGDRAVWCGEGIQGDPNFRHSILRPIAKSDSNNPLYFLYECEKCKKQKVNVAAFDDNSTQIQGLPVREFKIKKYKI